MYPTSVPHTLVMTKSRIKKIKPLITTRYQADSQLVLVAAAVCCCCTCRVRLRNTKKKTKINQKKAPTKSTDIGEGKKIQPTAKPWSQKTEK